MGAAADTYHASRFIAFPALLDISEMAAFFEGLSPTFLFNLSAPATSAHPTPHEKFLSNYSTYIEALKCGDSQLMKVTSRLFNLLLTDRKESVYAIAIEGDERILLRQQLPALQLQAHSFRYSALDGKVHTQVYASDSISWGITFSFPQLFRDRATEEILEYKQAHFPSRELFKKVAAWIRSNTLPVRFFVDGKRVTSTMRIGKKALTWINCSPMLKAAGIDVLGGVDGCRS